MEPRRPDLPIDVTMLCRISATLANHVEISWGFELGRVSLICRKILNVGLDKSVKTVQTQIRLLFRSSLIRVHTVCHFIYIVRHITALKHQTIQV